MEYCMIEVAFSNKEEVENVIDHLLQDRLVASCQVVESNSCWNWENKLEKSKEYLLFIKTKKERASKIYEVVKKIHSYDCFEFAMFNLTSCNQDYLDWIEQEANE